MKTEKLKEEIKALWHQLKNKTDFVFDVAPKVDKAPGTIYTHWFGNGRLSPGLPDDKGVLNTLKKELLKAPKK